MKVFHNDEIGPDAVLVSACLPLMFQAVERSTASTTGAAGTWAIRDFVIIHINPLERAKLPTPASEIMNRINEISFNSSLMREMRAIAFVTKLIDDGKILDNSMKRMLIHGIEAADVMAELGVLNRLNADWDNLNHLMKVGRERTDAWAQAEFRPARRGINCRHSRRISLTASGVPPGSAQSAITGVHPHNTLSAFPPVEPAPYLSP